MSEATMTDPTEAIRARLETRYRAYNGKAQPEADVRTLLGIIAAHRRTAEAVAELITAALAWHDIEFGAPGEMEAQLELSAVLNSYRAELDRFLAGAEASQTHALAASREAEDGC